MFSVWVIPTTAASDDYTSLLGQALVVNPEWENTKAGEPIQFKFRDKTVKETFKANIHFASYADAIAFAKKNNRKNSVILLCAGVYDEKMEVTGNVTIMGPNAGIAASKATSNPRVAWNENSKRIDEAIIKADIVVRLAAGNGNLTIDGLRFEDGGAVVDTQRNSGASTLTVKNTVFDNAGNEGLSNRYALYLRSSGHKRTVRLENLYITNMNKNKPAKGTTYDLSENAPDLSFIAPFFAKLYVNNVGYINNRNGFLTHSWFAKGVSPIVEVTNSCFYNESADLPISYAISMDNYSYDYDFTYMPSTETANVPLLGTDANPYTKDLYISAATDRSAASLKLHNNVFYQASGKTGVIHYEFVNASSVVDIQNNFVYADDENANNGSTLMESEFLYNSSDIDQSTCMVIKNNRLIGAYKVPPMTGSSKSTYIDMTDNYFGTTSGLAVAQPIFMTEEDHRLVRDSYWADEDMTKKADAWKMTIDDWMLAWVDDFNYSADLLVYNASDLDNKTFTFNAPEGFTVQLYRKAYVSKDGVITGAHEIEKIPQNKLTSTLLGSDPYAKKTVYAKIIKNGDSSFAPFYTINIENMGSMDQLESFAEKFPNQYMYKSEAAGMKNGTIIPYRWKGEVYKFEAGKTIFSDFNEIFKYAKSKGVEAPTILFPSGIYKTELVLPGSCTILGEQAGVNPNKTVVDTVTKENVMNSAWVLNPERNQSFETEFQKCIRVAAGIDNYIIEIDGIKMGKDCSYIDDTDRTGESVTIIKNVYAEGAVGGLDSKGVTNKYLFNFMRASTSDFNNFSIYNSRIVGLDGTVAFGSYVEKFVVDGLYFGQIKNGAQFTDTTFRSRDIANPYYAIKNSCFHENHTAGKIYVINFNDNGGNLAVKTNIVYDIDNNLFINGLAVGRGIQIKFTGNNMKLNFTNNTLVQESDSDTLFVSTTSNSRFLCNKENVSDMMNIKCNRMIGKNCLPCTGGTGEGTMFDWSGNYYAATYDGNALLPDGALRWGSMNTNKFTIEEQKRVKIDYTFLDWDMTVRSDLNITPEADYMVTGKGTLKTTGGQSVYTDSVSADQTTYDIPLVAGEYSTLKIYSNESLTEDSVVTKLTLPNPVNTYYAVVSSNDQTVRKVIKLVINREANTENELYYMDGFLIDNEKKTITAYADISATNFEYSYENAVIETSIGASHGIYKTKACLPNEKLVRPDMTLHNPCYMKVTSENGLKSDIYTLTFVNINTVDLSKMDKAAITYVNGMSRVNSTTFEAEILNSEKSFTFTPYSLLGGAIEVTKGNNTLVPNKDGSYTVTGIGDSGVTLNAIATSASGKNTEEYTLKIKKVKGSESELFSIENATKKDNGWLLNMRTLDAMLLKASVSTGATYQVYNDLACTSPCANNLVLAQKDGVYRDIFFVFVKVTSEDQKSSSIHKVIVQSQAENLLKPDVVGTVGDLTYNASLTGDNEYTFYLPDGTKNISLKGQIIRDTSDNYGNISKDTVVASMVFYADRNKTILIDSAVVLNQKVTKVYAVLNAAIYTSFADGQVYTTRIRPFDGVINIISDRASVNYKDAAALNNHWVKDYVAYLNDDKYGIFMGDDSGKINVESKITRYEITTVASRVLGLDTSKYTEKNTVLPYADKIESWALPYVRAITSNGIMGGNGEGDLLYFNGESNATREQVIKVLVGVCMVNDRVAMDAPAYYASKKATLDLDFKSRGFADTAAVSDWAVPYVTLAVSEYKMIGGSGDNGKLYLNPVNDITRAEVAKMVAVYYGF